MPVIESNNKRIARNTMFLYVRMLATLFIGLYTSRIVLKALGVDDYGIYSLIAGVVSLLAYLNSLLNQGTSRFLTIELGKGDEKGISDMFKTCFTLHVVISFITLVIGESIGLWFVNHELNISSDRMFAANIVYQCALFSSVISVIQSPFQASIISHERMGVYAYMSIYDVLMKLLVAWSLYLSKGDNLILYSILILTVSVSSAVIYNIYCRKHFIECRFSIGFDSSVARNIFGFMSWNAIESFSWMLNAQGFNVLMNRFFSTIVNAAIGMLRYISGAITMFVTNFQTSSRPQIFKFYAQGQIGKMNSLIGNVCRFSSYIMIIMTVPVIIETSYIYRIWLGSIPEYTVPFLRITIIEMLFFSMNAPLLDGIKAVGKLKHIGVVSSIIYIFFILIWYLCLKSGFDPIQTFMAYCLQTPVMLFVNLYFLSLYSSFSKRNFIVNILMKSCLIFAISIPLPYLIHNSMSEGWIRFLVVVASSIIISGSSVLIMGLNTHDRARLWSFVRKFNKSIG